MNSGWTDFKELRSILMRLIFDGSNVMNDSSSVRYIVSVQEPKPRISHHCLFNGVQVWFLFSCFSDSLLAGYS